MRYILMAVAGLLLLIGAISMVTPIPGGTLLLGVGGALLICTSETAARWVMRRRSGNKWLDTGMRWMEDRLGKWISDALQRTRPPDTL